MKRTNNRSIASLLTVLVSIAMTCQVYASKPQVVTTPEIAWQNHGLLVAALFKTAKSGEEAVSQAEGMSYLKQEANNKWFKTEMPEKITESTDEAELIKYAGCAKAVESALVDWADMALNAECTGTSTDDVQKATGNTEFVIEIDPAMQKTQNYKNAQDKLKVMHAELEAHVGKVIAERVKTRCCNEKSAVRAYLLMNCLIEDSAKNSFNEKLVAMAGSLWANMTAIATYVKDQVQGYVGKLFTPSLQTAGTNTVKKQLGSKPK